MAKPINIGIKTKTRVIRLCMSADSSVLNKAFLGGRFSEAGDCIILACKYGYQHIIFIAKCDGCLSGK